MGKTNQVGKSHTYPSNRQSYSKSRKTIEGRKKNFCFTKATEQYCKCFWPLEKTFNKYWKEIYTHCFFLEQKI